MAVRCEPGGRAGAWAPGGRPHLRPRPGRGRGHRAPVARDAPESNLRAGPRGGALSRRERGPGPGASAGWRAQLRPGPLVCCRQAAGRRDPRSESLSILVASWWDLKPRENKTKQNAELGPSCGGVTPSDTWPACELSGTLRTGTDCRY